MFDAIAAVFIRRGWIIVLGWVAFSALLYATAPPWSSVSRDDNVRFFPADYPGVIGQTLLERGFPDDVSSSDVVLVAERRQGKLTRDDFLFIAQMDDRFDSIREHEQNLGIKKITDHRARGIGPRLISPPQDGGGQAAITLISLKGTYVSREARLAVDRIETELEAFKKSPKLPKGLELGMTGTAAVGRDMNMASLNSVSATTYATIFLVVAILLLVYRSPLLAMIPLATIALSAWTALMAIPLLTKIPGLNFQVINITNIFVIVVLFGAGTDYCLFLIARYREELARGRSCDAALAEAIRQVGGALVASAGTVILGLGMLWFSTFSKIQYTGPAIALSLVLGLAASLTLAPVLLHWLRGAVFWPFQPPHLEKGHSRDDASDEMPLAGMWAAVSNTVVRRPGLILALSVAALVPLAYFGLHTQSSYNQLADLNPDQPSVVGARMVQRYFGLGEMGPARVLVADPKLDFRSDQGRKAIEAVSRELAALPNVAEVRSISRPLGKPLDPEPQAGANPTPSGGLFGSFLKQSEQLKNMMIRTVSDERYASTRVHTKDKDHIARFEIVFKTDPFSAESLETLDRVREIVERATQPGHVLAGAEPAIGLAGSTALVNDLKRITSEDEHRMYYLVTAGVYGILVVLLRKPLISLYLIATVLLGYLASLGLTELIFRGLHHGPGPWVGLDWKVGFFLFVILVAVGEDYNIFLMARVIEEERKHGPIEGTRLAVAHTGGIISSCGVIMAGTFLSMLFGSLTALRELGFALGLGVLLDTFVVRPILVPAFVVLWHRAWPAERITSPVSPVPEPSFNGNGTGVYVRIPTITVSSSARSEGNYPRPPRFR
jgi:RND superfamily putative drug exporter